MKQATLWATSGWGRSSRSTPPLIGLSFLIHKRREWNERYSFQTSLLMATCSSSPSAPAIVPLELGKCLASAPHGARLLPPHHRQRKGHSIGLTTRPCWARHLAHTLMSQTAWEAPVGIPCVQTRRRRFSEVNTLAQSHRARLWQSRALREVTFQTARLLHTPRPPTPNSSISPPPVHQCRH